LKVRYLLSPAEKFMALVMDEGNSNFILKSLRQNPSFSLDVRARFMRIRAEGEGRRYKKVCSFEFAAWRRAG